ncbi:hypothetical protein DFJ73DRAFT_778682 [Zopfochytrium polystomum]|nr:hypothetical protein DFJ73DRAFT_778682 [Zopfochytrium polystomum]
MPYVWLDARHGDHGSRPPAESVNGTVIDDGEWNALKYLQEPYLGQYANGYLYTHIITMTIAYIFLFPIGLMLAIRKSKLHFPVVAVGAIFAFIGYWSGRIFSHSTPDLYPGNFHHTLGNFMRSLLCVPFLWGGRKRGEEAAEAAAIPKSELVETFFEEEGGAVASRRSHSLSDSDHSTLDGVQHHSDADSSAFTATLRKAWKYYSLLSRYVLQPLHSSIGHVTFFLGLLQTTLGTLTLEGGALFLGYGLLTFARVVGCFSDFDHKLPRWLRGARIEFLESVVIFLYGWPNIYFENKEMIMNHKALQHQSLAFMWAMAGTASLLLECHHMYVMQRQHREAEEEEAASATSGSAAARQPAAPAPFVTNPIPAIIFLATGITLGIHEQETVFLVSLHTMLGAGLAIASLSRLATHASLGTEVLTAFGFVFAGTVFMAANESTATVLDKIWGVSPGTVLNTAGRGGRRRLPGAAGSGQSGGDAEAAHDAGSRGKYQAVGSADEDC